MAQNRAAELLKQYAERHPGFRFVPSMTEQDREFARIYDNADEWLPPVGQPAVDINYIPYAEWIAWGTPDGAIAYVDVDACELRTLTLDEFAAIED